MTRSSANTVVVIDGVQWIWQWIGEAMPHDHLAATFLEGGQIRVFRVVDKLECLAIELFVERELNVAVEIEGDAVILELELQHRLKDFLARLP